MRSGDHAGLINAKTHAIFGWQASGNLIDRVLFLSTMVIFNTFQDSKSDIWAYMTNKYIRIVNPESATRKERAKEIDYWKDYQSCDGLFGERQGVLPVKQLSPDWRPMVKQANGCLASAWARLAARVGEVAATRFLEDEWGQEIPKEVIEAGLMQKGRFSNMS